MLTWTTAPWGAKIAVAGFGIKDSKGRECGAYVEVLAIDGGYRVLVHNARNDGTFGAHPGFTRVATEQEALALVERRVEDMRGRVVRDAAKTSGVYLTAGERKSRKA